jgi:hypothetical protein
MILDINGNLFSAMSIENAKNANIINDIAMADVRVLHFHSPT